MRRKPRRHKTEVRDNHERWLISYADFITLLFAFFVVMYAISSVNEGKYRVLSDSLVDAFGKEVAARSVAPAQPAPPPARKQAEQREEKGMADVAAAILDAMGPLVKEGRVRITRGRRGVSVEINANVLFAPGSAELEAASLKALGAVADILRPLSFNLEITGHTDDVPISNSIYASNWELSAVRATSVARLFAARGIDAARLMAVGREASQPVESNATAEGRARNRRVTLLILSDLPDEVKEIPIAKPDA